EPTRVCVADGALVNKPAEIAELLAGPFGMSRAELEHKLTTDRRWAPIKRPVSDAVANELSEKLRKRSLRGIYFYPDPHRIYPNGRTLCHVLGFTDFSHTGVEGIEKSMEDYLRGHDGFRFIEHDRTGKELVPYRGQERPPRGGLNVRLTIDMELQQVLEEELDATVPQFKP